MICTPARKGALSGRMTQMEQMFLKEEMWTALTVNVRIVLEVPHLWVLHAKPLTY